MKSAQTKFLFCLEKITHKIWQEICYLFQPKVWSVLTWLE